MPHQKGEGINSKQFGTSKTLWVRVTHNVFQSTMKPLCSMDRHFWMKQNGTMTKKKKKAKKKNVLFMCFYYIKKKEVICKSSERLEFTLLNAKFKDLLEGSPKLYTHIVLKKWD